MKNHVIVLLLVVGAPVIARAEPLDEAKAAFAAGKQAFERGEYESALKEFQRANLLAPAPSLSYNIGKTYEALGRFNDAALAYERYLELAGTPQTDEDKQFQETLRARIAADKKRPDRGAPVAAPPQQPPVQQQPPNYPPNYYQQPPVQQPPNYPPNYYQQQPYYNAPYVAPVLPKQARLDAAKRRRTSGITTFSIGTAFLIIGLAITVDAVIVPHGTKSDALSNLNNEIEIAIGIPVLIVGPILLGSGAASWSKSQTEINTINREVVPGQPAAFIFHAPTVRF